MRFGRRGSLSVRLDCGTWFDDEAGEGGGVLDLVGRERQCSTGRALAWLKSAGFVASAAKRGPESPHTAFSRPDPVGQYPPEPRESPLSGPERPCGDSDPRPEPPAPAPTRERRSCGACGALLVPRNARPGARPPASIGPSPRLLPDVRWLAREAAPARDEAAKWYGLPRGAVGALAFAGRRPGELAPRVGPRRPARAARARHRPA